MRKKHVRNLTAGCAAFMAAAFVFSAGFSKTAFALPASKVALVSEELLFAFSLVADCELLF